VLVKVHSQYTFFLIKMKPVLFLSLAVLSLSLTACGSKRAVNKPMVKVTIAYTHPDLQIPQSICYQMSIGGKTEYSAPSHAQALVLSGNRKASVSESVDSGESSISGGVRSEMQAFETETLRFETPRALETQMQPGVTITKGLPTLRFKNGVQATVSVSEYNYTDP
jgi:hypothetical protein